MRYGAVGKSGKGGSRPRTARGIGSQVPFICRYRRHRTREGVPVVFVASRPLGFIVTAALEAKVRLFRAAEAGHRRSGSGLASPPPCTWGYPRQAWSTFHHGAIASIDASPTLLCAV